MSDDPITDGELAELIFVAQHELAGERVGLLAHAHNRRIIRLAREVQRLRALAAKAVEGVLGKPGAAHERCPTCGIAWPPASPDRPHDQGCPWPELEAEAKR